MIEEQKILEAELLKSRLTAIMGSWGSWGELSIAKLALRDAAYPKGVKNMGGIPKGGITMSILLWHRVIPYNTGAGIKYMAIREKYNADLLKSVLAAKKGE